jgi:hypothetical protein
MSETKSGSVTITVPAAQQPAAGSITINGGSATLLLNQTTTFTTVVLDANNRPTSTTPTWTSSDPTKATISSTGVVTAVGGGTGANVVFTARAGTVSATKSIQIIGHGVETLANLPQVFMNTAMVPAPATWGSDHQRRGRGQLAGCAQQRAAWRRHRAGEWRDLHRQLQPAEQEHDEHEVDHHSSGEHGRRASRRQPHDTVAGVSGAPSRDHGEHQRGRHLHRLRRAPLSLRGHRGIRAGRGREYRPDSLGHWV